MIGGDEDKNFLRLVQVIYVSIIQACLRDKDLSPGDKKIILKWLRKKAVTGGKE